MSTQRGRSISSRWLLIPLQFLACGVISSLGIILYDLGTKSTLSPRFSILGAVAGTILLQPIWKSLTEHINAFWSKPISSRGVTELLGVYLFLVVADMLIALAAVTTPGVVSADLFLLSSALLISSFLLRFVDSLVIGRPKRQGTYLVAFGFLVISLIPLAPILMPALQAGLSFLNEYYLAVFFFAYAVATLSIVYEDKEALKKSHPYLSKELPLRGFNGLTLAFGLLAANDVWDFLGSANWQDRTLYVLMGVMSAVLYMTYLQYYTRQTRWWARKPKSKEELRLKIKASSEQWHQEIAKHKLLYWLGSLYIIVSSLSVYFGLVFLYEVSISFSMTNAFLAVLLIGNGSLMLTYCLKRRGVDFARLKLIDNSIRHGVLYAKDLRDRLQTQIEVFGIGLAFLYEVTRYIAGMNLPRRMPFFGVPVTDLDLAYLFILSVILLILIDIHAIRRLSGGGKPSESTLRKTKNVANWTFHLFFVTFGGITGTIAYALNVPYYIDAPIIVGFLCVYTLVQLYLDYEAR